MADETYTLPGEPAYQAAIRRLRNDDLVDAEAVINPLVQAILENIHYLYLHGKNISLADLNEALAAVIAAKANSADVYTRAEVDGKISSVYKPGGSTDFANLPPADQAHLGMVYNVTDAFTATADFVEGAGDRHPAGTNVVVVQVGEAYAYDVLAGFVDLSSYVETASLSAHTGDKSNPHSVTPSQIGAAAASHGTHVSYSAAAPKMDGTAAAGTAGTVARSDHAHPTDTSRAAASHTHSKSQITDFPASLPASDVPSWAKAASKPGYTASEVGALPITGGTLTGPLTIGRMRLTWNASAGCLDCEVV